jgi:hypothetical protein
MFARESLEEEKFMSDADIQAKISGNKAFAGLKVLTKEPLPTGPADKKKKGGKKDEVKKEEPKKEEVKKEEINDDPNQKIVFDLQVRNSFSLIGLEPPVANKDLEASIKAIEEKKNAFDELVKKKADEIAAIRKNAETEVPSIEELKLKYKDIPMYDRDEKGTHGHKDRERRGARGGRRGGERGQWHGRQERHPPREGDEEKADEAERYEDDDSYEIERRQQKEEEVKRSKAKANVQLTAADFPTL